MTRKSKLIDAILFKQTAANELQTITKVVFQLTKDVLETFSIEELEDTYETIVDVFEKAKKLKAITDIDVKWSLEV